MAFSVLFIQETKGMIEMHFHVFASLAFLLIYRDWRVPVVAAAVIAVHHLVLNFDPEAHIAHLLPRKFLGRFFLLLPKLLVGLRPPREPHHRHIAISHV